VPTKTDFREFARHDRYRAFEIMLWWEGACNATDLSALFNVRRENVTKDIQSYRAEHGEQVIYDSINKTYRPSPGFAPAYIAGQIMEYVDFTRRFHQEKLGSHQLPDWLDVGPRPLIEPNPHLFRTLVKAIRYRQPIDVRYRSWNHPQGKDRCIHPHALANSGLRWHCRAFDVSTDSYRDFHLGRFEQYQEVIGARGITGGQNIGWNTLIDLELIPNPMLSNDEQQLVRADYGFAEGSLSLQCRQSMANYVLQSYNIVPKLNTDDQLAPRKHPLILKNHRDVAGALFAENFSADKTHGTSSR
jgi:hypothetical protein